MSNRNDRIISVLKDKHEYENQRRNYYDNSISLPVSLIAFIIAGCYFILTSKTGVVWVDMLMPFLILPLIICTVVSMFFLFRVFYGYKRRYGSFPMSSEVLKDYENIKDYHKNYFPRTQNADDKIDEDLDEFVIKWYIDSNDVNTKSNDVRMDNFHCSKLWIGICYGLGILVFSLYCSTKIFYKPMSEKSNTPAQSSSQSQAPTNSPKPADAPPPKPSPTPVRMEKGEKGGGKLR